MINTGDQYLHDESTRQRNWDGKEKIERETERHLLHYFTICKASRYLIGTRTWTLVLVYYSVKWKFHEIVFFYQDISSCLAFLQIQHPLFPKWEEWGMWSPTLSLLPGELMGTTLLCTVIPLLPKNVTPFTASADRGDLMKSLWGHKISSVMFTDMVDYI